MAQTNETIYIPTNEEYQKLKKYQTILHEGDVIKNYPKLCDILDEDIRTSDSKKAQQKEWKRYFDWKKIGHKIIIEEVFDEVLVKQDKRLSGTHIKYINHIEDILANHLLKESNYIATLTKSQLWIETGMTSERYHDYKNFSDETLKKINPLFSRWQVDNFYFNSYRILDRILFSALRNLERRNIITYQEQLVIFPKEIPEGEPNNYSYVGDNKDLNAYLKTKTEVMESMGCDNMFFIYINSKKTEEFYNLVETKITEDFGWRKVYIQYKIGLVPDKVAGYREKFNEGFDVESQKLELNKLVALAINKETRRIDNKNWESIKGVFGVKVFFNFYFFETQIALVSKFLRLSIIE